MKLVVITLMMLVGGQSTGDVITLEDALRLALNQSELLEAAEARVKRAQGDEARARSGLFPQIGGIASYQRTLESEFQDVFRNRADFGEALPFGRVNTWQAGLSLQQNIYTGGRIAAMRDLARAGKNQAHLDVRTTEGQVTLAVAEAYYDAALGDRLVTVAELTLEQAENTLRETEFAFRSGTKPEFEALRARVNRDNQIPIVNRTRMLRDIAYLRLKQALEIPSDRQLAISVSIDSDLLGAPEPFAARFAAVEANFTRPGGVQSIERTAVRAAETLVEQLQANLRAVKAERWPLIIGSSNYGKLAYPTHAFTGFTDLRTNWTFAITMALPIFTGGRQRGDEEVARAQVEQQRALLDITRELADLEARTAWSEVTTAHATWLATSSAVDFARRAYEIAEIRFQAGVSTQLELSDARLQLQQSQANRAQAGRNLQVARIKAALLPELPVSTMTTTIALPGVTTPLSQLP